MRAARVAQAATAAMGTNQPGPGSLCAQSTKSMRRSSAVTRHQRNAPPTKPMSTPARMAVRQMCTEPRMESSGRSGPAVGAVIVLLESIGVDSGRPCREVARATDLLHRQMAGVPSVADRARRHRATTRADLKQACADTPRGYKMTGVTEVDHAQHQMHTEHGHAGHGDHV